jgi:hypothetical protein
VSIAPSITAVFAQECVPVMTASFFALSAAGPLLEGLIFWRLVRCRAVRLYPYFCAFVLCDFTCNLILIAIAALRPEWFRWSSGAALIVSVLTGPLIVCEVVRVVFPLRSTLRRIAQSALIGSALVLFPAVVALCWTQANLIHFAYKYFPPTFEQYLCLAEALALLAITAVARYYGVSLGRNMGGMAFGFGLYLLAYAINFAALQVIPHFLPYWETLCSILYIGLLACWLWSFWKYAPPEPATGTRQYIWKGQSAHMSTAGMAATNRDQN